MRKTNRKNFFVALTFALTAFLQMETNAQEEPPRKTMAEIVNAPVVYKIPGMERVSVKKDLSYKTDESNPALRMDVYAPPDLAKKAKLPAVIFIHGGAGSEFNPKNWGVYVSWGKLAAASGMIGVTFTHRLGFPKTMLNEAASDVTDAIDYVRANADRLNVDKNRICLAAYSSGGPLLSNAMREKPNYVRCLVGFYAFMDVRQSPPHRESETAETIKNFSPITNLDENAGKLPPLFIARAGLDTIPTMNDSIDRFVGEALSTNAAIELMNHPAGVHGFDNQTNDSRSREIIRRAIDFLREHLINAPK